MPNEAEIRELLIKRARRDILTTLKMAGPGPFGFPEIALTLPMIERVNLTYDLNYLKKKGMVECINERPNQSWDDKQFELTALGIETADRINKDPALYA